MAKNKNELPADMWLHVAADAMARYVNAGGALEIIGNMASTEGEPAVLVIIPVSIDDPRLPASFHELILRNDEQSKTGTTDCGRIHQTPAG